MTTFVEECADIAGVDGGAFYDTPEEEAHLHTVASPGSMPSPSRHEQPHHARRKQPLTRQGYGRPMQPPQQTPPPPPPPPATSSMSVTQRTTAVMYSALERKLEKARQDRDALAEESAHEAQRTRVAAQAYERARRELQTRAAEAKTATSAARLLRKELSATRAELLGLQEQHHAALAHTQTLQAKLHQQGVELQEHRAQELGSLRDAVGKAARTPLRDQTRQRRSLSASRAPASAAAAARKTPAAAAAAAAA
eukprot:Rhum_TRINITY_DN9963_c0_g1::Rhum_TRINITY_DN9963_c0_g1_i1::g.36118::m.36118